MGTAYGYRPPQETVKLFARVAVKRFYPYAIIMDPDDDPSLIEPVVASHADVGLGTKTSIFSSVGAAAEVGTAKFSSRIYVIATEDLAVGQAGLFILKGVTKVAVISATTAKAPGSPVWTAASFALNAIFDSPNPGTHRSVATLLEPTVGTGDDEFPVCFFDGMGATLNTIG